MIVFWCVCFLRDNFPPGLRSYAMYGGCMWAEALVSCVSSCGLNCSIELSASTCPFFVDVRGGGDRGQRKQRTAHAHTRDNNTPIY